MCCDYTEYRVLHQPEDLVPRGSAELCSGWSTHSTAQHSRQKPGPPGQAIKPLASPQRNCWLPQDALAKS
ncbi:hypothetical protein TGAM01_v205609 [Trichoderma gamsii]|uniref:Uncharacterized protein n=1 Tax=Trichoderma gamsii TaxID=398673 RepID=A0A2P4ZM36_9HYPO|nr:hypothetical protein TGAM01_v205609 [Trichoderma gamsii]PON25315.1 hypothetical protein TGAM01_v205609 [Trichoderma gamsii]